jgi:3-oxoadipate enol-lactonase
VIRQLACGRVRARISGSGQTVWLFHSLLADAGSCVPFAQRLSQHRRVVLPDLPGFGGSAPAGPDLSAIADRMAEAIGELDPPAAIFGNGYGSFVALTLALRHPDLVRALVLAGAGAAFSELGRLAFRGMAVTAAAQGLAAIADTAMQRLFSAEFQARNPKLLEERRARFLATDPVVFAGACATLAEIDLRDQLRTLAVPTLVIVGAQDAATPPPMARELAGLLLHAKLIELPDSAHVPQLQETDRVVTAVADFI